MAEYIKNNPVALRHCLLYEYLQKNAYSRAFTNFRDTIGIDVFSEEELRSFFSQFRKRKMDGENGPITDMKDVLRNDKYALRACILYEYLKYKLAERGYSTQRLWPRSFFQLHEIRHNPSFALHSNFCKKLGDDVMGYPEFDFWFHRFVNEEFDLNYERDKDMKMLYEMPLDILENIVEYLNIFDRLSLAKTSHPFKTFVEDQKSFNKKLHFHISRNDTRILFENRLIDNEKIGNDCYRRSGRGYLQNGGLMRGVCYWKQGIQDLESILKYPKIHLENLCFKVVNDALPDTFDTAIDSLEMPIQQLPVKHLTIHGLSTKPLLKILPSLKPGYLTTIKLKICNSINEAMEKTMDTEQWKQAKHFSLKCTSFSGPLHNLYHFKKFDVRVNEVSRGDIRQMKEVLFKSPDFEKCVIRVNNILEIGDIGHEFGDAIQGRPNIYHYPIPNSSEYFNIELEFWRIQITRKKN